MQKEVYNKLSDLEHVLLRPDTFIGSLEHAQRDCLIWTGLQCKRIKQTECPALCSIVDEILTNAQDRQFREELRRIDIWCTDREICVQNDGKGIPIEQITIESENLTIWIPELVFGHFRAGSNFDDREIRHTGGRNGFGSSLTNAYSKRFTVEIGDSVNGKRYVQEWRDNMSVVGKPKITAYGNKRGFVKVSFEPDWERFGYPSNGVPEALRNYCHQRAYDVAACTNQQVSVFYNSNRIEIKNFGKYCAAVISSRLGQEGFDAESSGKAAELIDAPYAFQTLQVNDVTRLEVAIGYSNKFEAIGFVNGLRCSRGKHIDAIAKLACKALAAKAGQVKLKSAQIKSRMLIICKTLIDNPAFDSQTKECLATTPGKFGFQLELTDRFVKKLCELPILGSALELAAIGQAKTLEKTSRVGRRVVIEKLEDALDAHLLNNGCRLILTEGDSAKELAMAGLSEIGRHKFGVYPLIGKILNPRNASAKEILASPVSVNLMKIMGLEYGKVYDAASIKLLRYPEGIWVMSDQDYDGDHIASLVYNWMSSLFPSILRVSPRFISRFITPITATETKPVHYFFSDHEYEIWCAKQASVPLSRFLKGLASSSNADGRRYFAQLDKHVKPLPYDQQGEATLSLLFDKNKAKERKVWLEDYDAEAFLDFSQPELPISLYLDVAQRKYSYENCVRSLPAIDGFKPSQRKILFAMLSVQRLTKVSDLQGDIGRRTGYHHGPDSLYKALVGMAQVHWCTNNINLIHGEGQFGSRLSSKFGQARYLAARIEPIARLLFPQQDDAILNYLTVDGSSVEPDLYHGVIPYLLVNGSEGIATGFATKIPPFNPLELIAYLEAKLDGRSFGDPLQPYYEQFKGNIVPVANGWDARGCAEVSEGGTKVLITELAPGYNKERYLEHLDKAIVRKENAAPTGKRRKVAQFIKEIHDRSTHSAIEIELLIDPTALEQLDTPLLDLLKLQNCQKSFISSNNMVVMIDDRPRRFQKVEEIIDLYFPKRLHAYQLRLQHQRAATADHIRLLQERVRFIQLVRGKKINLAVGKAQLYAQLGDLGFAEDQHKPLLAISCSSLTTEKLAKLADQIKAEQNKLALLQARLPEQEWRADLLALKQAYSAYLERKLEVIAPSGQEQPQAGKKAATKAAGRKAAGKAPSKAAGKAAGRKK